MTSTTYPSASTRSLTWRFARPALVLAFWVGVWQVATVVVHQEILLVSPAGVLVRLAELIPTAGFWGTIGHSFVRISAAVRLAALAGGLCAALAATSRVGDALATPLVTAIRSTPGG